MPIFSVVIPVFNSADHISDTIRSVLNQTFQDFEILIIDDGSVDETADIISQFKKIKYFKQPHRERAAARNLGINNSLGEYIAFLDSDDLWLPNKLESDLSFFKRNNMVSLLHCDALIINENNQPVGIRRSNYRCDLKRNIMIKNLLITSGVCLKKECFKESGLFNEDVQLSGSEDWEMWVRLSRKCVFKHNPSVLIKYRQRYPTGSSAIAIERSVKRALEIIFAGGEVKEKSLTSVKNSAYANSFCIIALNYSILGDRKKGAELLKSAYEFSRFIIFDYKFIISSVNLTVRRNISTQSDNNGIAMLVSDFDSVGGLQKQAKLLISGLRAKGFKIFVITRNYHGLKGKEYDNGVFIRRFAYLAKLKELSCLYYLGAGVIWLIVNRRKYRFVQCYQLSSALNMGVLNKFFTSKPVIVRLSSVGEFGDVNEIRKLFLSRLRIFFLRYVDRFIVLNNTMKNELLEILSKNKDKILQIPNGIVPQAYSAFKEEDKKAFKESLGLNYKLICTYVGRLTEGKGLEDLIYCWKELSSSYEDAHLLLLGKGGMYRSIEAKLRRMCKELSIENSVHFLGLLDNVISHLLASDIFVLPSISEGMSNSLLEAMSCGDIIISTKISGNSELLNNSNSITFSPGDREALLKSLERVLNEPSEYYTLAIEAKKESGLYSIRSIVERYMMAYEELA